MLITPNTFISTILLLFVCACQHADATRQLVLAHRGASGYLPENSQEAIVAALMIGADFVEQDVVLTKDDVPIILHDLYLEDLTNVRDVFAGRNRSDGHYYAIDFTLAEVKQLRATERTQSGNPSSAQYPNRFPIRKSHFSIATLEERIELIQGMETAFANIYSLDKKGILTNGLKRKIGIYMELKHPAFHRDEGKPNLSEIVLATLSKYGLTEASDPIIIQCFDPVEVRRIRNELKSKLRLSVLLPATVDPSDTFDWNGVSGVREIANFANGIGPAFPLLIDNELFLQTGKIKQTDLYKEAKSLGLKIHVYTFRIDLLPPGIADFDTLMKIYTEDVPVDGVFSDFPDLNIQYLNLKNSGNVIRITSTINYFFFLAAFITIIFSL